MLALRGIILARTGKPNIQSVLASTLAHAGSPGRCVPQAFPATAPKQCGTASAWRGRYDIRPKRRYAVRANGCNLVDSPTPARFGIAGPARIGSRI